MLRGLRRYLEHQRTKVIKWSGRGFAILWERLPCRILSIEKQRYDELARNNHKRSHLYLGYQRGIVSRCPIPGCGGAAINYGNIKRAIATRNKAYHKNWTHINLAYRVEMGRGRDYLKVPETQGAF